VDLIGLDDPDCRWLWEALAAYGDRTGDAAMTTGTVTVTVPDRRRAAEAVQGFLPGRCVPGSRKRVDLARMTQTMAERNATPGEAAAAILGRDDIGHTRRDIRAGRQSRRACVDAVTRRASGALDREVDRAVISRSPLIAAGDRERERAWEQAVAIVSRVAASEGVIDRRLLVPDDPHALDRGGILVGMVRAVATAASLVEPRSTDREMWQQLGVRADTVMGGLAMNAIAPAGWTIPDGQIVTVPPAVLAACTWPVGSGRWVFVTENPSVLSAASEDRRTRATPLICLMGRPSALEVAAIARLEAAGWRIAVRADFDPAGLAHVDAVRGACREAALWRMGAEDYKRSLADVPGGERDDWSRHVDDPDLASVVGRERRYGFEEALLPELLADLADMSPA